MTLNDWQREAQEPDRFKYGVWERGVRGTGYFRAVGLDTTEGPKMNARGNPKADRYIPLPTILEHLAYERQECERCAGSGTVGDVSLGTTISDKRFSCSTCDGTGLSPDYVKARKWAERLGVQC